LGKNIADYSGKINVNFWIGIKEIKKLLIFAGLILLLSFIEANEWNRKSVSATEASVTFRSYFSGEFKGSWNEIRIPALG
jgi:hypothetical protein